MSLLPQPHHTPLGCHRAKLPVLYSSSLLSIYFTHGMYKVLVAQSCLTLQPMDCSLPGSSVHGILQAQILECVAILFSRGSSPPRNWTQVSCIAGVFFTGWATREASVYICNSQYPNPSHPPLFPLYPCIHSLCLFLYSALEIDSSAPFFYILHICINIWYLFFSS